MREDVWLSGGMDIPLFEQWRRAAMDNTLYSYKYIKFLVSNQVIWNT